ncbi:zinc finger protein 235 isoform X2 [Cryptotermes secundus]|uniref:zinc finger protein 235 isoform X2 n=1 Tax=Cryptotermes secundus TaxID=105785 RepID=UPI001454C32C|nr:zinc finger protein 235 isoform X2 [Cryptotermes secundus]
MCCVLEVVNKKFELRKKAWFLKLQVATLTCKNGSIMEVIKVEPGVASEVYSPSPVSDDRLMCIEDEEQEIKPDIDLIKMEPHSDSEASLMYSPNEDDHDIKKEECPLPAAFCDMREMFCYGASIKEELKDDERTEKPQIYMYSMELLNSEQDFLGEGASRLDVYGRNNKDHGRETDICSENDSLINNNSEMSFKRKLRKNSYSVLDLKRYRCEICGKYFAMRCDLKKHSRIHSGQKPFRCKICFKGFTHNGNLLAHGRTHTGEKPYNCDVCNKNFSQRGSLKNHYRTHTGEKPYMCHICNKKFTERGSLRVHNRTHTGEKPFSCDICNRHFSQKENLKNHYFRIHIGERPYPCDICNKRFARRDNLKNHYRIHTGDKPYKCDVCGKNFSKSDHLKIHYRSHTGKKPYACDICNKTFTEGSRLKKHYRIHTGERPYKCSECNKEFAERGNLRRHSRAHSRVMSKARRVYEEIPDFKPTVEYCTYVSEAQFRQ